MADLAKAIAAAREALAQSKKASYAEDDKWAELERKTEALLDALDAQKPVAWVDEFGNAYPLAAYSGKGDWRDDHKRYWRRAYAAPPAALVCTCPSGDGSLRWPCPQHPPAAAASRCGDASERHELDAYLWKRRDEWVLELSGSINGTAFTVRHAEPASTPPEDAVGLPSLYAPPAASDYVGDAGPADESDFVNLADTQLLIIEAAERRGYERALKDAMPSAVPAEWVGIVDLLVSHIERKTCTHEETYRGGAIWEICRDCGAKWADDEGGKPEFKWPACVETARAMLAAAALAERNKERE